MKILNFSSNEGNTKHNKTQFSFYHLKILKIRLCLFFSFSFQVFFVLDSDPLCTHVFAKVFIEQSCQFPLGVYFEKVSLISRLGFPGGPVVKNSPVSAGDGKISCRRKWQPSPVFLPGKFHGQRSPVGCSPWVAKSQTQPSS